MIDQIAMQIEGCQNCELGKTRKNTVPGEGPKNARIMFVGEAPGAKEDETGRPFVGRSGQLLTEVLAEAGIDRKRCFVTSPIKCRPPNNRTPKKAELNACRHWLEKQIDAIKPEVVCLLGNFATKTLLKKTGVTKLHGSVEVVGKTKYFVTFHPAAVIRGTVKREIYLADMIKLRKLAQ